MSRHYIVFADSRGGPWRVTLTSVTEHDRRAMLRIALAGKGGAGKTTISATLARLEARRGARVVAIDGDSNPNLGAALGLDRSLLAVFESLPASLVSRRLDGPALRVSVEEVLARHAAIGPDGVALVSMGAPGHAAEGCMCSAHATVSALLSDLGREPDTVTVLDMEASPEHLSRGTTRSADVLLLVTEPYYRSLETTRRLAQLASELPIPRVAVAANKLRSQADLEAVSEFCERHGLELIGEVPWADEVVGADAAGLPLLDAAPGSRAVAAIAGLLEQLAPAV